MKRFIISLLAFTLLLQLPVYSVRKDTKLILDQLKKVEEIVKNLDQKVTILATEFSSMYKKMLIVEEKVSAVTRGQADTTENKENLLLSLQFIKEEINTLKDGLTRLNDRLMTMPTQTLPAVDTEGGAEPAQNTTIQSPENIYYTAYSDYLKKNYNLAIQGFRQFLQLFPSNGLADNSLYWIGECYYTQRMYQDAVNTFTELIQSYSSGDKVPDATLKKGFALIDMGKESEGINILKRLIQQFPLSDEAKLAQQKIKEITDQ